MSEVGRQVDDRLAKKIHHDGGKNGLLRGFKYMAALRDHVVPSFIFREGLDAITPNIREMIAARCANFGSGEKVIARSSCEADFRRFVDVMPTIHGNLGDLDRIIREIRAKCADPELLAYAAREGIAYDPKDVTISVAPYLEGHRGLVSEHPNLEKVRLVDIVCNDNDSSGNAHSDKASHFSFDFLENEHLSVYGNCGMHLEEDARRGIMLRNLVRDSGLFSDDIALQIEYVVGRQQAFITQVKFFADVKETGCSTAEMRKAFEQENSRGFRTFGITPEDGLVLPCVNAKRRNAFRNFESRRPGVPYAGYLDLDGLTPQLTLRDSFPFMMAYFADKPPMSHNNFRPVQDVLRNGGVAFLNSPYSVNCEGAEAVKVFSDGLHSSIEAL